MIDVHTHTAPFSFDGRQSLTELTACARAAGLTGVCLTEHYDPGFWSDDHELIFDPEEYFAMYRERRQTDRSRGLLVLLGVEIGWLTELSDQLTEFTAAHPYDCVLLSLHSMEGIDLYVRPDLFDGDKQAFYAAHLREMTQMVQDCDDFDVLGHFDYLSRYTQCADRKMRYAENPNEFDALFSALIARDKALEINTRTIVRLRKLGYTGEDAFPDLALMRRYRELGGTRFAFGSDAHKPGECAIEFEATRAWMAKHVGGEIVGYIDRQPVSWPM